MVSIMWAQGCVIFGRGITQPRVRLFDNDSGMTSLSDGSVENIALVRQRLARSGAHLCLRLNDVSFASNKTFQHISR